MLPYDDFIEPPMFEAGDTRVCLNGILPKVPFRLISEDQYQELIHRCKDHSPQRFKLLKLNPLKDIFVNDMVRLNGKWFEIYRIDSDRGGILLSNFQWICRTQLD